MCIVLTWMSVRLPRECLVPRMAEGVRSTRIGAIGSCEPLVDAGEPVFLTAKLLLQHFIGFFIAFICVIYLSVILWLL